MSYSQRAQVSSDGLTGVIYTILYWLPWRIFNIHGNFQLHKKFSSLLGWLIINRQSTFIFSFTNVQSRNIFSKSGLIWGLSHVCGLLIRLSVEMRLRTKQYILIVWAYNSIDRFYFWKCKNAESFFLWWVLV